MFSVNRAENACCSMRNHRWITMVLLGAALVSQASVSASAESNPADEFVQRLARFNFTGTFRFKARPQVKQPSRPIIRVRRNIFAMAPKKLDASKSSQSPVVPTVKVIPRDTVAPKMQTLQSRFSAPSVKRAQLAKARNARQNAKTPEPPQLIAEKLAPTLLRQRALNAPTTAKVVTAQRSISQRAPAPETSIVKPELKMAAQIKPDKPRLASSLETRTVEVSPEGQQAAKSERVGKALELTTRSSLGANTLRIKKLTATMPQKILRVQKPQADDASSPPNTTRTAKAPEAPIAKTEAKPGVVRLASISSEQPAENSDQPPVTRNAATAGMPPLPVIFHRPVTATKSRRPASKKKKPTKKLAVRTKPKPKSKPKPSSIWSSGSPRWANGAFRTD